VIPCFVPPIITLTTDFGLEDAYVGVMKGVILGITPEARIVDISHAIGAQRVAEGTFILQAAYPFFSTGTIHVAVVDPGVGTSRLPLAIATPSGIFVGPDNGLFAPILHELGLADSTGALRRGATVVQITNPAARLPSVSATFHGRDIFAPAAAHLARGLPISDLGPPVQSIQAPPETEPVRDSEGITRGAVIHIDHFGNAVTNIRGASLAGSEIVIAGGREIGRLVRTYGEGRVMALVGSTGLVEIAVRNGNAAEQLGLQVGDQIQVLDR
jgi:S-adenosyl-L-methionine hydrolase (adenosine-forming)